METTAALTTNTFKLTGNLKPLDKDIVQLQQDYEIMKKNREQAKADLQAKFDEVYDKITQTKQMFVKLAVELNGKIQTFQKTNNTNISNLENKHNDQHNSFKTHTNCQLATLDSDIVKLDQAIEQEKLDRIRTEKENIENIQKSIDQLFSNFELEKQTRVSNEKKILNTIKDTSQQIDQAIKNEANEKEQKHQELIKNINHSLQSENRYSEGFRNNTVKEFHLQIDNIKDEINNRFDQQDKVVDDLRSVIRTIQNTLGILGKDV
ncbi:unnamed protein product [Paramecium sonneborni]|uniref:SF-assemblin n=1 Tax=Paramecium sonneborni TaxID=65129 RepID=A0A8S1NBV0_9CILI|nr:unnamed protein product [Paramecium sonneborni]